MYRHGNLWWMQVRYRGRTYRQPAKAAAKRDAAKELDQFVLDVLGGRVDADAANWTVSQLLDNLERSLKNRGIKALASVQSHGRALRAAMGSERVARITADRIERHKAERLADDKMPATVNRDLQVLRAAFRLAFEQELIPKAPKFRLLEERNVRQGFFTAAEVGAVVGAFRPREAVLGQFVWFAFLSAWRRGEIAGLTWDQVDRTAGEIRLGTTKGGQARVLPFDTELAALIEVRWTARRYRDLHGRHRLARHVFHRHGEPVGDFRKAWQTALQKAGLSETRLFHDLRRSAVREMVDAGVDQGTAMRLSGHETASMFRRYNIVDTNRLRDALAMRAEHRAVVRDEEGKDVGAKQLQSGYKRGSGGRRRSG